MARESIGIDEALLTEQNHVLVNEVLLALPIVEDADDYHEISNTTRAERVMELLVAQGKLNPESGVTPRQIAHIIGCKDYYIRRNLQDREEFGEQLELEFAAEA